MSTPLHALKEKNVTITIETLQGMRRSRKTKDVRAIDKIVEELQDKLKVLKKQG